MDYISYEDKIHSGFPAVSGSPTSPLSLYHAPSDIVFVNTGSGWQAGVQPSSNSVYSAVSGAASSTQTAIVVSVTNTTSAPSPVHTAVATKAASVIKNGH